MGLNFRKSISLGKGLKLNLSKSGPSVSFGKSGFRQSVNLKGQARTTVGIPGTGIYYTKTSNVKNIVGGLTGKDDSKGKKSTKKDTAAKGSSTKAAKAAPAAKQVNDGNYDVVLRPHGKDEISILTLSFSQLVAHLKAYISNLHELNEHLKEDNLTLEAATIRDPLTGVKNRFALRRDYEKYFEQDIHIMMLDLDEFKSINDSYGHNVGDYLLKKTGDALLDQFGAEHSYRYGGDEFLVIYPDISEEEFRASTKKLGEQLEEVYLDDRKLPVRFSAGYVYGKTVTQDDLRLMLRQADDILYQAKGSGKNTFIGEKYERSYAEKIMKKEEEAFRQG